MKKTPKPLETTTPRKLTRDAESAPQPVAAGDRCRRSAQREAIQNDYRLVQRCVAGDSAAWQQLYQLYHETLLISVAELLPSRRQNLEILDEITARVWFALVRNRAELLGRFDPSRGHRLADFVLGVARMVARQYLRSERRRRWHERAGARKLPCRQCVSESELAAILDEFNSALTAGERTFITNVLLSAPTAQSLGGSACSRENLWQRCHRLREKLQRFLPDDKPQT